MLKPHLQLGLNQRLAVTPQLRQALHLLQLPALDLQQRISEMLDSNVMLETRETAPNEALPEADEILSPKREELADLDLNEYVTDNGAKPRRTVSDPDSIRDRTMAAPESLQDHLRWQLQLARVSDVDFAIGLTLIDSIDGSGYLDAGITEVARGLLPELEVTESEVEAVLHRIQTFDPLGVGARSLEECLRLQLGHRTGGDHTVARAIIDTYLNALAAGQRTTICDQLGVSERQLAAAETRIRSLDPHPGAAIGGSAVDYVVADAIVVRKHGRWRCQVNSSIVPQLRINPLYERCMRDYRGDRAQAPLRTQLDEARWLLRSLKMRDNTLHKVASAIVEHQQAFLDAGEQALKPLGLKTIAAEVNMHESTISRVCAHKWMATPRGFVSFRRFFSNAVSDGAATAFSATAVRAIIRQLVADESGHKPLSDSRISTVLKYRGINVARRTVAKYRESLAIPPSHQRKS